MRTIGDKFPTSLVLVTAMIGFGPGKELAVIIVQCFDGFIDKAAGAANRAAFIDPRGVLWFVPVDRLPVGHNPGEAIRVLDARQTDPPCRCNAHEPRPTFTAA